VDAELAEIAGDPLAPQLFGDGGSGTGTAEEVGDEIAFDRAGADDAFDQWLRLSISRSYKIPTKSAKIPQNPKSPKIPQNPKSPKIPDNKSPKI
jgi:hypothetical protein